MKKITLPVLMLLFCSVSFAQLPCVDLFLSEYIKGSSNNKAIEIYNPTSAPVALNGYKLQFYYNGSNTPGPGSVTLSGTLAAGDVFVIANAGADAAILAVTDLTSAMGFNGDDAVALVKIANSDTIDRIGVIGVDPGTSWPVDTGSTLNHTLVRKSPVNSGSHNWVTGANEWIVYGLNDFTYLGAHTMDPCAVITNPIVEFSMNAQTVLEAVGNATVTVTITNPDVNPTSVDVNFIAGGTATSGTDFIFTTQTVTFPGSSTASQTLSIPITNDALAESNETFFLTLANPTNGALIGTNGLQTITITDDDSVVVINPMIDVQDSTITVAEGAGTASIVFTITNPNTNITTVDLQFVLAGSTATPTLDFTFSNQTISFPASSSANQTVTIPIIDDALFEGNEIFNLKMMNPSNGAVLATHTVKIAITDNDPGAVNDISGAADELNLFPNPAQDIIYLDQIVLYDELKIVNAFGQVMKTIAVHKNMLVAIDISELPAGIYFLEAVSNRVRAIERFVKY